MEPRAGGGTPGPRSDHGGREVARNRMARELERVLRAVGASRADLFAAVVLQNQDVTAWSRAEEKRLGCRVEPKVELGRLLSVLDTLVDFYHEALAFDEFRGNVI